MTQDNYYSAASQYNTM